MKIKADRILARHSSTLEGKKLGSLALKAEPQNTFDGIIDGIAVQ
jgi:hypothetical protein